MKITTFNPLIVTKDAENVIKLFEELGFERRHSLDANTGKEDFTSVRMKNAEGFYVDISQAPNITRDLSMIRMNVDDFDEALAFLRSVKLPVTLEEIGFAGGPTDEELDTIARVAVSVDSIKNLPIEVDEAAVKAALLKADELGRACIAQ